MLIALDYDKTYTVDPELWDKFIELALAKGHKIVCITMRAYPEEQIKIPKLDIIYTDRKAKRDYACEHEIFIDVWIDDRPSWILEDALPRGFN